MVSKSAKIRNFDISSEGARLYYASSAYSFFSGDFSGFPEKLEDSYNTRNSHAAHQHNENAANIG